MKKRITVIISLLCMALLLFFACSDDGTTQNYKVSFDENGSDVSGTMPSQTLTSQSSVNLTSNTFTRTGWVFGGWALTPEGSAVYSDGAYYTMLNKNVMLYAKWSIQITARNIFFEKNDAAATGTMGLQILNSGSTTNLLSNGFSKSGYIFWGWSETTNGTIAYTNGQSFTMGTANVYLYARWIPSVSAGEHYVLFENNDLGAAGEMTAQVIAQSASASLSPNTFTKDGWTFAGWATSPAGDVDYPDGASFSMGSSDVTLYAKWTPPAVYAITDRGPAGGWIFYDKGSYSDDWRYLEVSAGVIMEAKIWGVEGFPFHFTSPEIGSGVTNTYYLTEIVLETDSEIAAVTAANYSIDNGGVVYDNWFLPSLDELALVYTNLAVTDIEYYGSHHWSSTQYNIDYASIFLMFDGVSSARSKESTSYCRPIRAF